MLYAPLFNEMFISVLEIYEKYGGEPKDKPNINSPLCEKKQRTRALGI